MGEFGKTDWSLWSESVYYTIYVYECAEKQNVDNLTASTTDAN